LARDLGVTALRNGLRWLAAVPGTKGQVLRFGVVGVLAAGVDFGLLYLGVYLGASPYLARIVSVGVTVIFTWALNRNLTFAAVAPPSWGEVAQYVGTSLVGMVINYTIFSAAIFLGAPLWFALCAGTGTAMVFNFLRYRVLFTRPRP
jgi:putative flippase GtrA